MKFTLYPNDELKFKLKQSWTLDTQQTLIQNQYCYSKIEQFIERRKIQAIAPWPVVFTLEIKKGKGKVKYDLEDLQLDIKGEGKTLRVISIDVILNEKNDKARIKVNLERVQSLTEKIQTFFSSTTSGVSKKIDGQKSKKIERELNDTKHLEEIIKQKAKETITNEY